VADRAARVYDGAALMRRLFGLLVLLLAAAVHAGALHAQDRPVTTASVDRQMADASAIDGPPAPVSPDVVVRDELGRATVRAVRIDQALRIDGRIDEEPYQNVTPIDGFIQQEPRAGEPATENTEVWIFFDDTNLYVSARCWDSHPERWVISGLQRDMQNITESENFTVVLDTFYDRRNGFYFQTNVAGGMRDQVITDEGNPNASWNTVWTVRSGRFAGGWTVEMAIPFKSLRYRGSGDQVWGINLRRTARWKNEVSYLTKFPAQWLIYRLSGAGTLVGLQTPAQSKNLELKPYVVSSLTTDRAAAVPYSNSFGKDAGVDFKYGLTRSLIADFTYNTDFAQAEEDLQQVNLTRFSLLFPEKRDFFLEGQGTFTFGGASAMGSSSDVPILFFSRRIGLNQGQVIPVMGGGRLTGKAGPYDVGVLDVVTDEKLSAGAARTNFSVVRVKRGILGNSYIGMIGARRSPTTKGTRDNMTMGADLNVALSRYTNFTSYFARTQTPLRTGDASSYRTRLDYASDRYGFSAEHLKVGVDFNPEVGFLSREKFRRTSSAVRFSPRPKLSKVMRKYTWTAGFDNVTDPSGRTLESRETTTSLGGETVNGDLWSVDYTRSFEFLEQPFRIAPAVALPVGGYHFQNVRASYNLGNQQFLSGRLSVAHGSFYNGDKTEAALSGGRIKISAHLEFQPSVSTAWVSLQQGRFTTHLGSVRMFIMPTARMLISSLVQYNPTAHSLSSSARLRWEYTSGSELFLVYSDGHVTNGPDGGFGLTNRTLALKVTRLFRL
jgi:hypothetical protein